MDFADIQRTRTIGFSHTQYFAHPHEFPKGKAPQIVSFFLVPEVNFTYLQIVSNFIPHLDPNNVLHYYDRVQNYYRLR